MATGPLTVGPKPPEVTMPTSRPSGVAMIGALAGRRAALGLDADAHAGGAVRDLALDAVGARKAAFLAAALLDRPDQAGLDGRGRGVDVVAVEAEARLEAQRIAGAEADGLHFGIGEQGVARAAPASAGLARRSRSRPRPYSRSGRRGSQMPSICTSADIMKGMSAASGASSASTAAACGPCRAMSAQSVLGGSGSRPSAGAPAICA